RRLWPRPMMTPRCTSTEPIGMPPSASPCSASAIAASRNASIYSPSLPAGIRFAIESVEVVVMLHMALVFLVIGILAALLGFTTIAGASFAIAKFLAGLFLVLFLIFLIIGLSAARRIID